MNDSETNNKNSQHAQDENQNKQQQSRQLQVRASESQDMDIQNPNQPPQQANQPANQTINNQNRNSMINQQGHQEDQEGQLQQEQQQHEENIKKQNNLLTISEKQNYINKLENQLNRTKKQFEQTKTLLSSSNQENLKIKESLKKLRFQSLSSKNQISTLHDQKTKLTNAKQFLQNLKEKMQKQIQAYKEAGDINYFKNQIKDLQNLVSIQKKEIEMKCKIIDEKEQLTSENVQGKNKIQILNIIEKYEQQNKEIVRVNTQLNIKITNLTNQLTSLKNEKQDTKLRFSDSQTNLSAERERYMLLEQKFKATENEFNIKLKRMQEQLINFSHHSHFEKGKKIQEKNPQQLYGIKILSPHQQRDLILKEYIQLELKFMTTNQQLQALRNRHYNTLKQLKNVSANYIQKKQYNELYKRYTKLRKCLQNSIQNEQNYKKQLNSQGNQIISEGRQNIEIRPTFLQQPQNPINQIENILQKSGQTHKQLFTMKQQLENRQQLIRNQKLIKQHEQKNMKNEIEISNLRNMIQLYDKQLCYKNNELELFRKANSELNQKILQLQHNCITKQQRQKLFNQRESTKNINEILEIKNMQLLKENNILKSEKNLVNQLYNNLKTMYEELLNKKPELNQSQSQHNNQYILPDSQNLIEKPCKVCQQNQEKGKNIIFSNSQIQTDEIGELYFKQLKQLLTILRKFPKKVESIRQTLQGQQGHITQIKKKYDQVIQSYSQKSKTLQQSFNTRVKTVQDQKKQNDQWRVRQRQQIREQFQQIREFILNDRLLHALRRAKSLIQYYEQQQAPQEQDNGQNEENKQDKDDEEIKSVEEEMEEQKEQ